MLPANILSVIVLVITPVLADGAAIVDSLGTLAASAADLNNTLTGWDGGLLGTLPIVVESGKLLANTNKATTVAKSSANLTALEALGVATSIQGLIKGMNVTLTSIVDAKPKFDHLLLSSVILLNLVLEKHATDDFAAAVIAKVPSELAGAATEIVGQADALFDIAIDAYDGPF